MVNKQVGASAALMMLSLVISLVLVSSGSFVSASDVLQVPSTEYPTIQSAINAAVNGSTITIAPGVYNENVATVVWVNNSLQTFSDLTIQGSKDTVINGDAVFGPLINGTVDSLTITGKLTVGNSMEGLVKNSTFKNIQAANISSYTKESVFSHLQISSNAFFAGTNNTVSHSVLNVVQYGGNAPGVSTYGNNLEYNFISGGVKVDGALYTAITGNTISGSQMGITEVPIIPSRYGSGGHTIQNNTIQNCSVGLNLGSAAYYHLGSNITQNTIKDNNVGIAVTFSTYALLKNTIFQNSFINNKVSADCATNGTDNWSYGTPQNGNYWSDYNGLDSNNDGIGDAPYVINSANQDNYPLMYPGGSTPTPQPTPTPTASPQPTSTPMPSAQLTATTTPTPTPPTTQPTQIPAKPTPTPTSNPTVTPSPMPTPTPTVVPETNLLFAVLLTLIATPTIVLLKRKAMSC